MRKTVVNNGYLKRYFACFDIPNPMYKGSLTVKKRDDNDYSVEFKNVSFHYPGTEVCAFLLQLGTECGGGARLRCPEGGAVPAAGGLRRTP